MATDYDDDDDDGGGGGDDDDDDDDIGKAFTVQNQWVAGSLGRCPQRMVPGQAALVPMVFLFKV